MSGHSKWSTIKHKKAALDAKRGKVFTKIIKEITIVSREGGGDPAANPRLRTILEKAKRVNMPQDNIQRAIKKGTGELPGQAYESISYEGYGPSGIALIVEVLTDNKNRAAADLRHAFSRHGGRLGETGSVNWMFDHLGVIRVATSPLSEEQRAEKLMELMELLLDFPVHDILDEAEEHTFTILAENKSIERIRQTLQEHKYDIKSTEIEWIPKTKVTLATPEEEKAIAFLEALDELDDVQNTYTNL